MGKLSLFLGLVQAGKIPPGTYLLVESLDRLSRDSVHRAFKLLIDIITSGIRIVSLLDNVEYSEAKLEEDPNSLFIWLGTAIRANQESVLKSERISESWVAKRERARRDRAVMTSRLPGWLRTVGSGREKRIELWPERAQVVRQIFEMTINGYGRHRIVRRLNEDKVPTFRGVRKWQPSIVVKILRSRAVLGELQPYRSDPEGIRLPDGDPISDYFPPVVSLDQFNSANAAIFSRRRSPGRRGALPNLLQGMVYCGAGCGSRMSLMNKGPTKKGGRYFVCSSFERSAGCTNSTRWRVEHIENAILDRALKVDWSEFDAAGKTSFAVSLDQKRAELTETESAAEILLDLVQKGKTLALKRFELLQAQADSLAAEIADMEQQLAITGSIPPPANQEATVQALRQRLEGADEATAIELRTKISQTLKWSIDRIHFRNTEVSVRYHSELTKAYPPPPPREYAIAFTPERLEQRNRENEMDDLPDQDWTPIPLVFRSAKARATGPASPTKTN